MVFGSLGRIGELQEVRVESESGFACLEWRIPEYHGLPPSGDSHYRSDSFRVLGESWHLNVRPCPDVEAIYVRLVKEASPTGCSVKYRLRFKEACVAPPNEFTGGSNYTFGAGEVKSPCTIILRITKPLEWLSSKPADVVSVVCLLKKLAPYPVTPESRLGPLRTEKLAQDLSDLILSGKYSDFTVQVKGEEFRLHKGILSARSPVFQAMFEHDMAETQTGRVSIDDCDLDEFRALVRYVYTGRTTDELHADVVFGLFALADKYQVDELKSACLAFVRSTLSAETFCDVVQLALRYDDEELLEQAADFLSRRSTAVMKTDKWKNFLTENPMQANELLMKAFDKKQH